MAHWTENLHPRDAHGRFIERGGGWMGEVSDRMAAAHGFYTPVRGRDIRGELHYPSLFNVGPRAQGLSASESGDRRLAAIVAKAGFDGMPEVVDAAEMDARISAGWVELWRGVQGAHEDRNGRFYEQEPTSREYAEQFRSGDFYPGIGVRGNGTYSSPHRSVAQGYTRREGDWWGPVDHTYEDPSPAWPGLIRMALRPDAKLVEHKDIERMLEHELYGEELPDDGLARVAMTERRHVLGDEGRLAAALGYDAIVTRSPGGDGEIRMVIVLNRTAVAVQEAWK